MDRLGEVLEKASANGDERRILAERGKIVVVFVG
jgi:hypothetical protein